MDASRPALRAGAQPAQGSSRRPTASGQPLRRKPRPIAFWLHSIFGLKLSLFLAFICLTGTIATVAHEIEWLYKPDIRATAFEPGKEDWGAMWAAAQTAYPQATLTGIGSYDRSASAIFAKSVSAVDEAGEEFAIYVDPGTGQVTGHEHGRSLQNFMRGLHQHLLVPGAAGFYLVTSLGFVLLVSLVTGLIVYKKFWRGFFVRPRSDRNLRTLMGDLHRLVGLWSTWFAAIVALTSIFYFFERLVPVWESEPPQVSVAHGVEGASAAQVAQWVETARRVKPGLQVTAIYLPFAETDPAIVQGHWQAALVRERADAVFIDPVTDAVLGQRTAHEMGVAERIVHTADPLHFGTFGGLATRLLWALFGLALTGMAISGAYIYAKRTKLALREGVNLGFLDYLGTWKWPSVGLITVVPAIAFWFW